MRTIRLSSILFVLATSTRLAAATISVQPATLSIAAGRTFELTVQITGATDLYGYQFDLGFNPSVLAAVSVGEGPFLAAGGATIFIPGAIDNVGGSITANADILQSAVSGVNGSGTLLDVFFHTLAPGSSSVQVFNVFALNSLGQGLDSTTANASVDVTASVPEPETCFLLGLGVLALSVASGRRGRRGVGSSL